MLKSSLQYEVFAAILLALAILTIYWQTGQHDFLIFDDNIYVTENKAVQQGLTLENLQWAFSLQQKELTYWHPLTWISHMMDVSLFGLHAKNHHMVNVFWHVLNTILLFLILHRTTNMFWQSFSASLLFAVHPLNVETVAWIAERKNLLSTFFGLLTIITYIYYTRKPNIRRYLLLSVTYLTGLFAKPMLVTLPFVLLLLDYWPLSKISFPSASGKNSPRDGNSFRRLILRLLLEKVPLLIMAITITLLVSNSLSTQDNVISFQIIPLSIRIENWIVSYIVYIKNLFLPYNLAVFYPFPDAISPALTALCALLLCCITYFILGPLKNKKYLVVGWFWFIGSMVPVSGIIQAGLWPSLADRWAYIPFIGLFILIVWAVGDLAEKNRQYAILIKTVSALYILLLGIISWQQVHHWKNSATLFEHTLKVTDNNYVAHNNIGLLQVEKGFIDNGIDHFTKSVQIKNTYYPSQYNLGLNLMRQGFVEKGIFHLETASEIKPDSDGVHNNLGIAYGKLGKYDQAIFHFSKALQLNPDNSQARNNLIMLNNFLLKQKNP